jgi:UrcA family protein
MLAASHRNFARSFALSTLLLGVVTSAASAQGSSYSNGPTESVEVIAPRFHADTAPLNGPMEKVSYSERVRYDDLNLLTRRGVHEFRARIWETAQGVCVRLVEAYPVYVSTTEKSCVRRAYEDAMVRAYGAISDKRISAAYWYGY